MFTTTQLAKVNKSTEFGQRLKWCKNYAPTIWRAFTFSWLVSFLSEAYRYTVYAFKPQKKKLLLNENKWIYEFLFLYSYESYPKSPHRKLTYPMDRSIGIGFVSHSAFYGKNLDYALLRAESALLAPMTVLLLLELL